MVANVTLQELWLDPVGVMPPRKSAIGAHAASSKVPNNTTPHSPHNATYLAKLGEHAQTILSHPVFKTVQKAQPLTIKMGQRQKGGGVGACFDTESFNAAIRDAGCYNATCNFWWVNPLTTLSPNVPVNEASVDAVAKQYFSKPARFPGQMAVGVIGGMVDDPMATAGNWDRTSPEELGHALILSVARRIADGATEEELREWRQHMLTVQFSFQMFSSEDEMFWRAITLRQNLATEARAMVRTVFQMVHEVAEVRRREELPSGRSMSSKNIYDAYCSRATMHGTVGEDEFTQSFVDNALSIHSRLFSNKARG